MQERRREAASGAVTAEHTLTRRDGTSFLAEIVIWWSEPEAPERLLSASAIWQVRDISAERSLARELRDLEDYHRELARKQWDMTFVIDRKGRISYASSSIEDALGHRVNALLGEPFTALLAPSHAAAAGQWLRSATGHQRNDTRDAAEQPYHLHVLDRDGRERVLACRPRNCFDVPRIAGMVVHARDIGEDTGADAGTEPRADAAALRARLIALSTTPPPASLEARVGALLDAARDGLDALVAVYREFGSEPRRMTSPADRKAPPSAVGTDPAGFHVVDDVASSPEVDEAKRTAFAAAKVAAFIDVPVAVAGVVQGRLVVGAKALRSWRDPEIDFVFGVAQAIAAALVAPASTGNTDATTGLPGRDAARQWLERRVAERTGDAVLTLLSIDLDRLQNVNDRHGHAAGDAVIARSARAIAALIGAGGYAARVGGDEFIVVLVNAAQKAVDETVGLLLARIRAASDDDVPSIEASVGIARLPSDAGDAATLWLHADLAMQEAKRRGRGQAFVFSPRLATAVRVQKALDVEIADALARDEFVLFYQPQIALATGKVVGFEALLRWQHPTRGLLLPDAFIDAAVERGLIEAITKSVVGQVCDQIATWRRARDFPELPVSVNVAGNQFHDRRLPALVASALLRCGLPARLLILELAEQILVGDDPETERVVKELDRLGVRTAVGGFALGHGALKQLRQLRVAQIKVDRGFVDTLPDDEAAAAVVGTVIDIARRLKCQVIAEGVETRAQFEHLRARGCEAAQGFYFSPPLSPDEIGAFVDNNLKNPVQ